jgi:hypothetical protein
MATRVVTPGTTIVKRIAVGVPTKINEASVGTLARLDDVNDIDLSSSNQLLLWDSGTSKFNFYSVSDTVTAVYADELLTISVNAKDIILNDPSDDPYLQIQYSDIATPPTGVEKRYALISSPNDNEHGVIISTNTFGIYDPVSASTMLRTYGDSGKIELFYNNQGKLETTAAGVLITGQITANSASFNGNVLPSLDSTYSLGSAELKWKDIHLSDGTIYLGNILLKEVNGELTVVDEAGDIASINLSNNTTTDLAEGDNLYYTTVRADSNFLKNFSGSFDSDFIGKTTDNLAEGNNLYYTTARADSAFDVRLAIKTTDDLVEGGNLYYTKVRTDSDVNQGFVYRTTTDLTEGDNLYYTDARARSAISLSTDSDLFSYDSITGVLTVQETKIARTDREETFDAGINIPDGQKVNFDNGSSDIFENGNDLFIRRSNVGAVGSIYVMTSDSGTFHVQSYDGNRSLAHFIDHGGVQLYNDGILKLEVKEDVVEIADKLRVGNDVVILGNLQVDGTQTIINSTTISINDKNIVLADSAADSSAANGAGITINGANATILYNSVTDTFDLNKSLGATRNHLENFSTTDLDEGNKLYYTKVRVDSDVNQGFVYRTTTDLIEGNNLYYTTARADSDAKNALVGGTGITYTSSTGTIDITDTTVVAGTYGSASLVPIFTINAQGQIDSAGTVSVAGVSSTSYDSSTGVLTINTADGGVFNTTLHDSADHISRARNALSLVDAGGDGSFTYDGATGVLTYTGPSATEVRSHFSAAGDLTYDSTTGQFSFDIEQVYTKSNFDSDWNAALDQAALNGTGLTFDSATNTLSITATGVNAGTYGSASLVPVFTVNAQGQIDSAGTVSVAGVSTFVFDSASATLNIGTADGGSFNARIGLEAFSTTNLDEGNNLYYTTVRADSDAKNAISAGNGITYTASTGAIDITNTAVVAATYGSTTQIPVFTVNSRGQIDSAGVVTVAGVSSVSFDSASGILTISTADGGLFNTTILDSDFTASRTRSVISAIDVGGDGSFTYDSATGIFSYTGPSATEVRSHFQVLNSSGDGSLAYDSDTGSYTYTGPSASEVRAHFSASTGVTLSSGAISIGQAVDSSANVNFNTATVGNVTINETTVYGQTYGSLSINTNQFKGDATQTVFDIVSDSENAAAIIALSVDNQYSHAIGTTGTAASNDFVIGFSGTNTELKIRNNVGDTPFNLSGGNELINIGTAGQVNIYNASEAISKTNAAVTITGGLGVSKNIRGQDIIAAGNVTATGNLFGPLSAASLSARSTTDLAEGTRKYYTDARVDSYVNTSIFTTDIQEGTRKYYTKARTDSDARRAVSVTDAGGDGSLAYDNTTGVITYTGPSATEVRARFSAGTGVTLTSGVIAIGQAVGTGDSVENLPVVGLTGNFSITGDLVVGGAYILNETTDLRVTNALIKLADSNTNNVVDIGVVADRSLMMVVQLFVELVSLEMPQTANGIPLQI